MPDERDLIAALRRRDQNAFAKVFNAHSDKIFRLAVSILGDENEAESVVQETFLRLIEKLDQFEERSKLSTWLYRVAYNISVDHLRQKRPAHPLTPENDDDAILPAILTDWTLAPEPLFASAEAQQELERGVVALPERLRSVFILRELEGLSTIETAEVLNIRPGTVKVRLHRARLRLRETLSGYFVERISV